MVEVINNKVTESIVHKGDISKVYGMGSCKSFRSWCYSRLKHFIKTNNKEYEMIIRHILMVYDKFHPETKVPVEIKGWRGKSGIEVTKFPNYFEVIEWRKPKPNCEAKRISNKISFEDYNALINVLKGLELDKIYPTKEVARIWARINKIFVNSHGKKIFDIDGFNYGNIAGCRSTYMLLYYPLKIASHYKLIEYGKSGTIKRISKSLDVQEIFSYS